MTIIIKKLLNRKFISSLASSLAVIMLLAVAFIASPKLIFAQSKIPTTKPPPINQDELFINDINIAINILSGLVGIVIVIMIVVGGIQYSASGDNPQAVAKAKSRILNALIALLAFIFLFAFLNWLVPGGLLN